jgi:hypothetical protein
MSESFRNKFFRLDDLTIKLLLGTTIGACDRVNKVDQGCPGGNIYCRVTTLGSSQVTTGRGLELENVTFGKMKSKK